MYAEIDKKNTDSSVKSSPSTCFTILVCLLVGVLSVFFAEVLSGSLLLWFIDPWGLIVVFPLYMMHLLFLFNLALRTKRVSIPQLYLWGIIFALYESWITKVLWNGYPGDQAQFGLFLGIAFGEFIVLVFFFHPIYAFIFPIMVYELLVLAAHSENEEGKFITKHLEYLKKNKKAYAFLILILIFSGSFIAISSGYNFLVVILALLGSLFTIFILYLLVKKSSQKQSNVFSVYSLRLSRKGFTIVATYLIGLYLVMFFILAPSLLPKSPLPYLIIILSYIITFILLYFTKPNNLNEKTDLNASQNLISLKDVKKIMVILLILAILFTFIPPLTLIIGTLTYLFVLVIGLFIFSYMLFKAFKK